MQFAYQVGKGVDEAKIFILDKMYEYLEKPRCHAKPLFADFSSAFNKIPPKILIERLTSHFNLLEQIVWLLLNFLTNRVQWILVNGLMSDCFFKYWLTSWFSSYCCTFCIRTPVETVRRAVIW